jgi:hypothetical protein
MVTGAILVFILAAFPARSHAKTVELSNGARRLLVEEKTGWTLGRDLFGMPFIFFSPQTNGQRSNISFTDTGAEVALDVGALAKNQDQYQEGRRRWARQVEATPLGFTPYEAFVNARGHRVHKIGFSYAFQGKTYVERSYYVECRGRILFSKSLRLTENDKHEKDFSDLVGSLDCGGA